MDFSNNIGSLSVFASRAGQGKSFAMLYHALKNGRDFVYVTQDLVENELIRRVDVLYNTYGKERNLKIPDILVKHLPDAKYVRDYIGKLNYDDIYIDCPDYFYRNPFEAFDLMCGKNVHVSQQLAYNLHSTNEAAKESGLLLSEGNLLKNYIIYKENQIINVTGSEEYQLDMHLIQRAFMSK